MTRSAILSAVLLSLLPCAARADAIAPYDGECPPGLVRGIAGHAEACIPRACERDAQCSAGAACRPVDECWAEREVPRGRLAGTEMRRVVVGACDAQRRCADADATCQTRHQCEPVAPTPAWDRTRRAWTRVSHPRPRGARPAPGVIGCGVSRGQGAPLAGLFVLALLALRRPR